jgi:3-hydroxyisobutyrate dehydrogenase-like beta-hydroxyacid dehydrogenase
MPDLSKSAVTVLGLGAMGTALAEAVLAAGHPATVWNRSAGKAAPLVAQGAVQAATAAEAIADNRFVLVCLLDYDSVREVLDGAADALAGKVVVNLTNGTPAQARALAAWVAARGAEYLDGGIMAVPPMIATPGAFILYSGSTSAFDTYRPVFDVLGESHYLGTDPGLAPLHDIALLSGMYGQFMGALHAFALVNSEGGKAADFAPLLGRWLTGMSGFVLRSAGQIDSGDYTTGVVSSLGMQAAAYRNLLTTADDQGVSPELLAPLAGLLDRGVADGRSAENFIALVELLKK